MSAFILKFSCFAALVTFIVCMLGSVSFQVSLFRALIVFVGAYAIVIVFFIGLRIIFTPNEKRGGV